jgi:hypothetical protein
MFIRVNSQSSRALDTEQNEILLQELLFLLTSTNANKDEPKLLARMSLFDRILIESKESDDTAKMF